jgi:hypothetical protein
MESTSKNERREFETRLLPSAGSPLPVAALPSMSLIPQLHSRIHTNMIMLKALVLASLTVVASSAVAAEDDPEEVIRALYKAHRPWEHKELNLGNRAVLSKYFSPELTKLFLKNAQLERDCPKGDLCGLEFDPILGSQDFDDHLDFKLHITETTPPQTGRFEARFKLFNEEKPEQEQILVFQLIQVKNGWRIDDITYTKDNASLKAVITAILDEAAHLKE